MPSNAHCRRIDSAPSLQSTSWRRSGGLIFRTSWLFHDELADLGVETFDLPLAVAHDIAIPGLESPRRLLLKLLLPGVNLIRVHLVTLGQIGHRRLLPQRLQRNLRLQSRVDLPSRSVR